MGFVQTSDFFVGRIRGEYQQRVGSETLFDALDERQVGEGPAIKNQTEFGSVCSQIGKNFVVQLAFGVGIKRNTKGLDAVTGGVQQIADNEILVEKERFFASAQALLCMSIAAAE